MKTQKMSDEAHSKIIGDALIRAPVLMYGALPWVLPFVLLVGGRELSLIGLTIILLYAMAFLASFFNFGYTHADKYIKRLKNECNYVYSNYNTYHWRPGRLGIENILSLSTMASVGCGLVCFAMQMLVPTTQLFILPLMTAVGFVALMSFVGTFFVLLEIAGC